MDVLTPDPIRAAVQRHAEKDELKQLLTTPDLKAPQASRLISAEITETTTAPSAPGSRTTVPLYHIQVIFRSDKKFGSVETVVVRRKLDDFGLIRAIILEMLLYREDLEIITKALELPKKTLFTTKAVVQTRLAVLNRFLSALCNEDIVPTCSQESKAVRGFLGLPERKSTPAVAPCAPHPTIVVKKARNGKHHKLSLKAQGHGCDCPPCMTPITEEPRTPLFTSIHQIDTAVKNQLGAIHEILHHHNGAIVESPTKESKEAAAFDEMESESAAVRAMIKKAAEIESAQHAPKPEQNRHIHASDSNAAIDTRAARGGANTATLRDENQIAPAAEEPVSLPKWSGASFAEQRIAKAPMPRAMIAGTQDASSEITASPVSSGAPTLVEPSPSLNSNSLGRKIASSLRRRISTGALSGSLEDAQPNIAVTEKPASKHRSSIRHRRSSSTSDLAAVAASSAVESATEHENTKDSSLPLPPWSSLEVPENPKRRHHRSRSISIGRNERPEVALALAEISHPLSVKPWTPDAPSNDEGPLARSLSRRLSAIEARMNSQDVIRSRRESLGETDIAALRDAAAAAITSATGPSRSGSSTPDNQLRVRVHCPAANLRVAVRIPRDSALDFAVAKFEAKVRGAGVGESAPLCLAYVDADGHRVLVTDEEDWTILLADHDKAGQMEVEVAFGAF